MSLDQDSLTEKKRKTGKSKKHDSGPIEYHFTEDGKKRYCTKRPKGKDELVDNWDDVTCQICEGEKRSDDNPEWIEKLRKKLKE